MIKDGEFYFSAEGPFTPDRTQMIDPGDLLVILNGVDYKVEVDPVEMSGGSYEPFDFNQDNNTNLEP